MKTQKKFADIQINEIMSSRVQCLMSDDTIHDVGNKTIRSTLRVLPKAIQGYFNNKIKLIDQPNLDDRDFRRMDLNAESIAQAYHNFDQGMLKRYLENKNERDMAYTIVDASFA